MKKRIVALLSAVVMVVGMSMTAMAAPSVSGGVVTGIVSVKDAEGNDITAKVAVRDIPADYQYAEEVKYIRDTDNMIKELGDAYEKGMKRIDLKDVYVLGDEADIDWNATITFKVNGVSKGQKVVLLHWCASHDKWEVVKATAGNKTITAVFHSLSPVAFIAKESKAPTTGEPVMLMCALAAVAVGSAGIVASKKRR